MGKRCKRAHSDDLTADDYVVNEREVSTTEGMSRRSDHLNVVCCPGGANIKRLDGTPVDDELLG